MRWAYTSCSNTGEKSSSFLKDREIYLRFSSLITAVVTFIWVVVSLAIDAPFLAVPA